MFGCRSAGSGGGISVRTSSPTLTALETFSVQAPADGTMPLADATEFEWDRAWFFLEGSSRSRIEEKVGVSVLGEEAHADFGGPLLVFVHDGAVVEVDVAIPPLFVSADGRSWVALSPDSARVRAEGAPPAARLLTVLE